MDTRLIFGFAAFMAGIVFLVFRSKYRHTDPFDYLLMAIIAGGILGTFAPGAAAYIKDVVASLEMANVSRGDK